MVFGIKSLAVLCILLQLWQVDCRVIDNENQDIFRREEEADPYGYFEEDEGDDGEPMMSDQPAGPSHQYQLPTERPYRQCSSPADCYPDECCRIGMQRFSEPSCMSLGKEGDFCKMDQEPVNTTLSYPNGVVKEVTHGYVLFCPCTEGLTCLRALCRPYKELYLLDGADVNNL